MTSGLGPLSSGTSWSAKPSSRNSPRSTSGQPPSRPPMTIFMPRRDSSNQERLNGDNGLLLTPSIDHLFDRGFIGFEDNGELIISPVAHQPSLERMGIRSEEHTSE